MEENGCKEKGFFLVVEGDHQICSFLRADNFWIMPLSKEHLEQMIEDLIEEAVNVDLEPKTCESVVNDHLFC